MKLEQSYKSYLRECIRKLEDKKRFASLSNDEREKLEKLYDEYENHQIYLNESGQAYEYQ